MRKRIQELTLIGRYISKDSSWGFFTELEKGKKEVSEDTQFWMIRPMTFIASLHLNRMPSSMILSSSARRSVRNLPGTPCSTSANMFRYQIR